MAENDFLRVCGSRCHQSLPCGPRMKPIFMAAAALASDKSLSAA
jgi:hypothetical protein